MSELSYKIKTAQVSENAFEVLLNEYQSYILACASRAVNHYVTKSDDEWSVALIAFHEAVKSYDDSKGDFNGFSSLLIRRRLTDHLRKEYRHSPEISTEPAVLSAGNISDAVIDETSDVADSFAAEAAATSAWPGQYTVRDEIDAVQGTLQRFGFSFFDVAESSPKSQKTKEGCAKAAAFMLRSPELTAQMMSTGNLPIKTLAEKSGVKSKTIERHRRYIVAAVVILTGDYPLLSEYMRNIREEADRT